MADGSAVRITENMPLLDMIGGSIAFYGARFRAMPGRFQPVSCEEGGKCCRKEWFSQQQQPFFLGDHLRPKSRNL
jgi:hypothetical protein